MFVTSSWNEDSIIQAFSSIERLYQSFAVIR